MSKWWDTDMMDAGQAMFVDPQLATQLATAPDKLLMTAEQQKQQMKLAQDQKAGFWQNALQSVGDFLGKTDKTMSNLPGGLNGPWRAAKDTLQAAWYPVDKTAEGARWLYSEAFSQPFSTLLLQGAKAELGNGNFFSGWGESYHQAEHISPGQAFANYENTRAASGEYGALTGLFGPVEFDKSGFKNGTMQGVGKWLNSAVTGEGWQYVGHLDKAEQDTVKRQQERFLVDTKYWQQKEAQVYNRGSGALDFYFVIFGDPTTPIFGGAANAIKAGRSVQFIDDGLGLVRTRGNALDYAASKLPGTKGAPQTAEEYFVSDKNMNHFYDWVASPGTTGERKSASEIAAHPVWGRGRRVNPFANQFGEVLSKMPREDMNLVMRFAAGDNQAAVALAGKGNDTLNQIGKLTENRVMLSSTKMDDEFLSYFAAKEDAYPGTPVPYSGTGLFEPPVPRPGPGATEAQKKGWEARWGPLAAKAELGQQAAASVRGGLTGGIRPLGPTGGINADDLASAQQWKSSQLDLIDGELKVLAQQDSTFAQLLGWNAGKTAEEFEAGGANLFGTMDRAYRMGGLGLRSTEASADKKFAKSVEDRKGRFATQGYRSGFYGTPTRFVQSFGDRVPESRVDHNAPDASDRVLDMLKQVPGLTAEQRAGMLDRYVTAGDKTAKSAMLSQLNTEIVHHIAGRVNNLDPEVAQILSEITKVGIDKTLTKLTKGNFAPTTQTFGPAEVSSKAHASNYHIEDGEVWQLGPMAKTQLQSTDTLLPILELNRQISRASGAVRAMRNAGATAQEAVKPVLDGMNSVWKAATLLRPGYVPRMISEEAFASAIKFGFMSRLLADPAVGTRNFVENRGIELAAITGHGSYVPPTGKGLASNRAIVRLEDESKAEGVLRYKENLKREISDTSDPYLKSQLQAEHDQISVSKIRVNKALPVVQTRISMEKELADNLGKDVTRWTGDIKQLEGSSLATDQLKVEGLKIKIANAQADIADHHQVISEFTDYHDEIMRTALNSIGKRMGEGTFTVEGREIPQAFSKEWENPISREQIAAQGDKAFQSLYARGENVDMGRAVRTGSWTHISPDKPNHMESWLRAVNFQFRQDDLFRLVAEDATGKKALNWLTTPSGKNHLRDLGPRARNGKQLVEDIKFTLDKYLPVEALQQKLAKGEEVTAADLTGNISKGDFPIVHGEEVKYLTKLFAKDASQSIMDRMIAGGFNRLGSIPSDLMSRSPVYSRFFEARMRTMIGQDAAFKKSVGKPTEFTNAELERMKDKADKLARKDMSQIVYDPQRTMGGEALRFIFPFFNAHADGLARWAGLLGEKPQEFSKMAKLYNAPVSANMTTDKYGNVLDSDGTVTINDPVTGKFIEKHKVNIQDRVLRLRLPWKEPGKGPEADPISLSAINTILPGDPWFHPGTGPMIQVPASAIAKASPTAGDFLQWSKILPYGPTDTTTAFTPKYMRAMYDRYKAGDPDGEKYQAAYLAAYNKRAADYHKTGEKFTTKDVENDAKHFLNLQILTAWGSPAQTQATPLTGSPYQFFVDEYKKMQNVYGQDANDVFLEKYGSDYYGFTASLNKSMGIAATESADAMAQKYKDLLDRNPEMAPFIIGNVYNGGPFNDSVYKKQMEESFGSEWVREKTTAKDAITQNQIDQGWKIWNAAKLQLDATLIRRGNTSYSQSGAEDLNQIRANMIENIGSKFPGWGEEFTKSDKGKVPNRIEAFEDLTRDKRLLEDPFRSEVKVLRYYLDRRALYQQVLRSRGGKELSVGVNGQGLGENADIAEAWDHEVTGMINSNLAFNQLYNRYLSNDRLQ